MRTKAANLSRNPWGLDVYQERVLDLLVTLGADKRIARELDISPVAVRCRLERIRERMGVDNRIGAAIAWDRFAMGRDESEAT